ncbi:MAG: 50S ribosomal protein L19 [Nitrospirota bacterium]|nr:50S ribosomal protein L19 [Nitrospirota bacterium]
MNKISRLVEQAQIKSDIPAFRVGDTLKVHVKVVEGEKTRVQVFEGIVIRRRGDGLRETFTVRKISSGIGVERIFPLNSPMLDKIQVVRQGHVHQARLFYLRDLRGKAAQVKEKDLRAKPAKSKSAAA